MSVLSDCVSAEDRLQRVRELSEFTQTCQTQLGDIYEALGWSWDQNLAGQEELVQCPLDPDHRVPQSSLQRHTASCCLRKMGYTTEELAQMHDSSVCYKNSSVRSFVMDKSTQHQVIVQAQAAAPLMKMEGVFWQGQFSSEPVDVPQNHQRALCDLTVADRLALYDHVTAALSNQREAQGCSNDDLYVDLVKKLQKGEQQNEPKSHLELMAEMRDYKRRRQSYRAKNVHITKKSYTEVIREVINVNSEELSKQWREEEEENTPEPSSHRHHHSEQVQHSSPESPSRPRHSREKSHDIEHKKKKKKKRLRDSHSPDDHHERKKKKKKRKKDEREKEK